MSRQKKLVIGKDLEGPERPLHIIWRDYQQATAECHEAEANLNAVMARFFGADSLLEPVALVTPVEAPQCPPSIAQPPLFDMAGGAA